MTEEVKKGEQDKGEEKLTDQQAWDKVGKDRAATQAVDAGVTAEPEKDVGKDAGEKKEVDPNNPYAGLPELTRKLIEGLDSRLKETEGRFTKVNQQLATAHGTIGNLKQRLEGELKKISPTVEAVEAERKAKEMAAAEAKAAKVKDLRGRLSDLPDVAELMDLVLPADAEPAKEVKAEPKAEPKKEPERAEDADPNVPDNATMTRLMLDLTDLVPGWRKTKDTAEFKEWLPKQNADIHAKYESYDPNEAAEVFVAFGKHKDDAAKVAKVEAERQERLRRGGGPQGRGSSASDVDTGPDALWNKVKRDRERARQSG